jgi:hypothetical protein
VYGFVPLVLAMFRVPDSDADPMKLMVNVTWVPAFTICGGAEIEKPVPVVLALVIAASSVPEFCNVNVSVTGTPAGIASPMSIVWALPLPLVTGSRLPMVEPGVFKRSVAI